MPLIQLKVQGKIIINLTILSYPLLTLFQTMKKKKCYSIINWCYDCNRSELGEQ